MNKEYQIRKWEDGRPNMIKAPSIAVGFSQRTMDAISSGLQPHILKMWLKPIFLSIFPLAKANSLSRFIGSNKPTAIEQAASNKLPAATKRFSTVFQLYSNSVLQPPFGGQGGFAIYQANRQLGLPADNFFNN
jgi:hypothetical protein